MRIFDTPWGRLREWSSPSGDSAWLALDAFRLVRRGRFTEHMLQAEILGVPEPWRFMQELPLPPEPRNFWMLTDSGLLFAARSIPNLYSYIESEVFPETRKARLLEIVRKSRKPGIFGKPGKFK